MNPPVKNFDRLARPYHLLERLVFGSLLERARFRYLEHLQGCRRILLLGDGDSRVLARVCALNPQARIDSLDLSPAMLARAEARLAPADRARVQFRQEDACTAAYEAGSYDAVVTFFFLDCFSDAQAAALVGRIQASLTPKAVWLFADFAEPAEGWRRLRAQAWLAILYAFFRWQTGLTTRRLPDAEALILGTGMCRTEECTWQHGWVRSVVFRQP